MPTYRVQKDGSVINTVKPYGNHSARVQVPVKWLGKVVRIEVLDDNTYYRAYAIPYPKNIIAENKIEYETRNKSKSTEGGANGGSQPQ